MLSDYDAGFLGSVAYEMQFCNYPQTAELIRDLIKRYSAPEPEITLPGPDGEPNESVPMDFFS